MNFAKLTFVLVASLVTTATSFAGESKILECKSDADLSPRVDGVLSVYLSNAKVDQLKTYKKIGSWGDSIFEKNVGFLQYRVVGNVVRKRDGKPTAVDDVAFGRLYQVVSREDTKSVPSMVQIFSDKKYGEDRAGSFRVEYGTLNILLGIAEAKDGGGETTYFVKLTCDGVDELPTLADILPAPPTAEVKARFTCETTPSDPKRSTAEKFQFTLKDMLRLGSLEFVEVPGESEEETVYIKKLSEVGDIADAVNTEGSVIGTKRTIRIHGDQISMVYADVVLKKPKTPGDSITGTVDFERSSATTDDGKTLKFQDAVACTTELVK